MSIPAQGAVGAETMTAGQVAREGFYDGRPDLRWEQLSEASVEDWERSAAAVLKHAALASPRADSDEPHFGYLFHNPDTGEEWSESHPIESGEVEDAENVRPATAKALHELLIEAWSELEDARADLYSPAQPAGAVLDSLRAPEGYALVPIKATEEMLSATYWKGPLVQKIREEHGQWSVTGRQAALVWQAMIEAYLASHPAGQSAGSGAATDKIADLNQRKLKGIRRRWEEGAFLDDGEISFLLRIAEVFHEHRRERQSNLPPWSDVDQNSGAAKYAHAFVDRLLSIWQEEPAPDSTRTGQGEAPDGWVLAPVEPTEEMLEAFCDAHRERWDAVRSIGYRPGPGDVAKTCYAAALAARPAAPEAQGSEREGFNAGYAMACANIVNLHGEDTIAEDVLAESGITLAEVKALGLTDYDMKPLRALFREIARKRKISKAKAAPPASSGQEG